MDVAYNVPMASKVTAFLLTFIVNIIAGIFILFMMLVGMNGYSESDAQWGLIAYIVLTIAITVLMSLGAVLVVGTMVRRQFSAAVAVLTAVPAFSAIGIVLEIVSSLIGVGIAEFVRVNY